MTDPQNNPKADPQATTNPNLVVPKSNPFSTLMSGVVRRIVAGILGVLLVVLNDRFNLGLSEVDKASLIALITGYIFQSAFKEAAKEKAAVEAKKIDSLQEAVDELRKRGEP